MTEQLLLDEAIVEDVAQAVEDLIQWSPGTESRRGFPSPEEISRAALASCVPAIVERFRVLSEPVSWGPDEPECLPEWQRGFEACQQSILSAIRCEFTDRSVEGGG